MQGRKVISFQWLPIVDLMAFPVHCRGWLVSILSLCTLEHLKVEAEVGIMGHTDKQFWSDILFVRFNLRTLSLSTFREDVSALC